ncbi:protein arginine N-methyltransferase 6-like, partial [Anneissia japonica]|uniref:protein arginine N-methyltransferase 6-like n=1 Tax=Anneissia japonica TaxID=1529436 RepID=UPI00142585F1
HFFLFVSLILEGSVHVEVFPPKSLIGFAEKVIELDLSRITQKDLEHVKGKFMFKAIGETTLNGFVAWFTVQFDCANKGLIELSTSPYKHPTHWRQCVVYLNEAEDVQQDTTIQGTVILSPNKEVNRFLEVEIKCKVGDGDSKPYSYIMDDRPS